VVGHLSASNFLFYMSDDILTNDDGTMSEDENLDMNKEIKKGMDGELMEDGLLDEELDEEDMDDAGVQAVDDEEEGDEIA
jgi:hypothetical protein